MKNNLILYYVLLTWIFVTGVSADNYVIINQVMYDTPLNEVPSISPCSNGEYIELYNAGTDTVSLQGWHLYGGGNSEIVSFADTLRIPAGNYLVIACRRGQNNTFLLDSLYTMPVTTNYTVLYQNKIMLSNEGETVTLYNAQNEIVDQMHYYRDPSISNWLPGDSCISLHRKEVEFDSEGKVVSGSSHWQTALVTFGESMLPYSSYYENYITGDQTLPIGENYILSITPLDPTSRIDMNNGHPSVSGNQRIVTNLEYFDGLGRSMQTIGLGQSPSRADFVTISQYTGIERLTKTWLSVPMQTEGQLIGEADFMDSAQDLYSEARSFTETIFENSALNRRVSSKRPGHDYPASHYLYDTNGWGVNVAKFEIESGGLLGGTDGEKLRNTGDCFDHVLYLQTTIDENGDSVTTFMDKENHILLERRNGEDTYYVYDRRGFLRYVLSPKCVQQLTGGTYDLETDINLRELAYCYQYDGLGNQIYKRLPGCAPQYMVYDALGQLVLKQDGNQREHNRWTVLGYDSIGRNIYTAEITENRSHKSLIEFYGEQWQAEKFSTEIQDNALLNTGYASTIIGTTGAKVLTVNYYDTYDFLDLLPNESKAELSYEQRDDYGEKHENSTGLLTGTRIYSLSDSSYVTTAYYYDYKGRMVQQHRTRHAGGYEKNWFSYNYDGSISKRLTEIESAEDNFSEAYDYTYDHAGRTLEVKYKLNNTQEITLNKFSHDTLGRLAQNLRVQNQDTIRYSYDMRSAMTDLQSAPFSERLFYSDSMKSGMASRYDGSIAAAYVIYTDSVYRFAYTYDRHNRLLTSRTLTESGETKPCETFDYDHNGNIRHLIRYNGETLIDDLTYTYMPNSNRLATVTDEASQTDLTAVKEYCDNHTSASENDMEYDANGNMISDADRGISFIKYNILNLPDTVQFANGNRIVNLYDAAGIKYKSIYYTVVPTAATPIYDVSQYGFNNDTTEFLVMEYAGNVEKIYSASDTLYRIYNTEGYHEKDSLYCYYRDHLGNIVAVRNMVSDSIVQLTRYYASGLPMAHSSGQDVQPHKYNGKEFIEMYGLDEYNYGFRGYYAPIGRFTSVDPITEQTPWISPYAYAENTYVNAIDWMGLSANRLDINHRYSTILSLIDEYPYRIHYTEIDDDGIVTKHIDNEDNSVVHNGKKVGTELENETYVVGWRSYFKHEKLGVVKVYNFNRFIYVRPHTPWEDRVARWLRAKNVDKMEKLILEKEEPLIRNLALLNPILGMYNSAIVLLNGENIYGQNTDEVDQAFAIVSLLSFGAGKIAPIRDAAEGFDSFRKMSDYGSCVNSIIKDYGIISSENP